MKAYGKSRPTTASPDKVWSIWSDPNNWNKWNTGIRSAQIDGPLRSGATGTMETVRGSKHAVVFSDVVPMKGFTMTMNGPMTKIHFTCEITSDGSGSVIAQSAAFSGPLAFLMGPMMGPQMATHFVPVLDGLAAAAEAA